MFKNDHPTDIRSTAVAWAIAWWIARTAAVVYSVWVVWHGIHTDMLFDKFHGTTDLSYDRTSFAYFFKGFVGLLVWAFANCGFRFLSAHHSDN